MKRNISEINSSNPEKNVEKNWEFIASRKRAEKPYQQIFIRKNLLILYFSCVSNKVFSLAVEKTEKFRNPHQFALHKWTNKYV